MGHDLALLVAAFEAPIAALRTLPDPERIAALNHIRRSLHAISPLRDEPIDCVEWVPADCVSPNDYNPNAVAPAEMALLHHSIRTDGYTQPIVAWQEPQSDRYEIVDGFHRHRVGRECADVRDRVCGYLPIVTLRSDNGSDDRAGRIAATIRHNRARGKHRVDAMTDIVLELARRNWTDAKIGRELGMEPDEVLRLKQISGLADLFADREFSEAWDVAT